MGHTDAAQTHALLVQSPDALSTEANDASVAERERRWLDEHREAIESWNDYVEVKGLPLETYRRF